MQAFWHFMAIYGILAFLPGPTGQTGQSGQTGQTGQTVKLDFPGNLSWTAILAMFFFIQVLGTKRIRNVETK